MNKPLIWINTLSSALHARLDNVVADELRATTSNICNLNRGLAKRVRGLAAPNDIGVAEDRAGQAELVDRKVA